MSKHAIISGFIAAGLMGFLPAPAQAQSRESGYAVLGKWIVTTVWARDNVFGYCAATTNNGRTDFRIGTDGRGWQVGTPFYGRRGNVSAYYGFGVAAEVAQLRAEGDGWASMPISADQLAAFRQAPAFSLNLGPGEQTWDLRGASAAIDKARECASRRGVPQQVAQPVSPPVMAAPPPPPPSVQTVGRGCPAPGSVRSQNDRRPLNVTFYNATRTPLDIVWIGYDGSWTKYQTVRPNQVVKQRTFATHPWVAVDPRGNCKGGVMIPNPNFRGETPEEQFQIWD